MQALETDRLAELVCRKHNCLVEMQTLGQRQFALVESGDMTNLLSVLAAKQRLLNELQEVERGLDPFRLQQPEERRWRSAHDRQLCADQAVRCEELFRDILAQEKQSERHMCQHRDEAALRLRAASAAHQARDAYTANHVSHFGQLDLITEAYDPR